MKLCRELLLLVLDLFPLRGGELARIPPRRLIRVVDPLHLGVRRLRRPRPILATGFPSGEHDGGHPRGSRELRWLHRVRYLALLNPGTLVAIAPHFVLAR